MDRKDLHDVGFNLFDDGELATHFQYKESREGGHRGHDYAFDAHFGTIL